MGESKKDAVIRLWKANPRVRTFEIAITAGCTVAHASQVISTYLAKNPPLVWPHLAIGTKLDYLPNEPKTDLPVQKWPPGPAPHEEDNGVRVGAKAKKVLDVYRADPSKPAKEIAAESGATREYVYWVLRAEKDRLIGEQRRLKDSLLPALTNQSLVQVLDVRQEFNPAIVSQCQSRVRGVDREVLQGRGLTHGYENSAMVGLLDGVVGMVDAQLNALVTCRSQLQWDTLTHELSLTAAFCFSSVAPVAKGGIYRGLRGDEFFSQIAKYIRQRVAAGPFGC